MTRRFFSHWRWRKKETLSAKECQKHCARLQALPGMQVFPGEWDKALAALKQGEDINYEGAAGSQDFDETGRRSWCDCRIQRSRWSACGNWPHHVNFRKDYVAKTQWRFGAIVFLECRYRQGCE